jgi:hypothetical protein
MPPDKVPDPSSLSRGPHQNFATFLPYMEISRPVPPAFQEAIGGW